MDLKETKSVRGIFSIIVVLHHLSQRFDVWWLRLFENFGILAVAYFFFMSGYGLQKSHMKSHKYIESFLQRRLPKIIIPYVIVTIIFNFVYACEGNPYSVRQIITAIGKGNPVVPYSWYIIAILIFYIFFYFLMFLCKRHYNFMIIGAVLWLMCYVLICKRMGFGGWWYATSHLLIVGMIAAIYEKEMCTIIACYGQLIACATLPAFLVLFVGYDHLLEDVPIFVAGIIMKRSVPVLFIVLLLIFLLNVRIDNCVLSFLGEISFEVYLIQGLFIKGHIFGLLGVYMKNPVIICLISLTGIIVSASVLHYILRSIMRMLKI